MWTRSVLNVAFKLHRIFKSFYYYLLMYLSHCAIRRLNGVTLCTVVCTHRALLVTKWTLLFQLSVLGGLRWEYNSEGDVPPTPQHINTSRCARGWINYARSCECVCVGVCGGGYRDYLPPLPTLSHTNKRQHYVVPVCAISLYLSYISTHDAFITF